MPTPLQLKALQGLRSLNQTPYKPEFDSTQSDPSSQLYQLQNQRADELKDRMFSNQRAQAASLDQGQASQYGGEVSALRNMLGDVEGDLQSNPITAQRGEVEDYNKREREAILAGYGGGNQPSGPNQNQYENPIQAQSRAQTAMEQAKINIPVEAQRVAGQADIEQQRVASQGLLDVANTRGAQAEAAIQAALASGKPIRSLNPTTGAFSFQTPPSSGAGSMNPLLNQLTQARFAMEKANQQRSPITNLFYGDQGPEKEAFNQALANVVSQTPGAAELKSYTEQLMQDPGVKDLPVDQILSHLSQSNLDAGDEPLTEEEKSLISHLVYAIRGK